MRVILTGGGTGGHIYPALAIGQALSKNYRQVEFLYVGSETGLEKRIVAAAGFPFVAIDVLGWQRRVSLQTLKVCYKTARALFEAHAIVHDFQPDLVIGTGGYVSLPVVWAAARQQKATFIHEQNAFPGLANKFLSRRVSGVLLTYPEAAKYFAPGVQKKLHITGLPIRPAIMRINRDEGLKHFGFTIDKPVLLVVGGSRGAGSINRAMLDVYKDVKLSSYLQIIHLVGAVGYEAYVRELRSTGIYMGNCGNINVMPYLQEMEYAVACADLCVARAGAAFLSEMTAKGVPGILIPYPLAAENHQEYNARTLVDAGAAEMILDRDLNGKKLLESIRNILYNDKRRLQMQENSLKAGKPEALEKIIRVITSEPTSVTPYQKLHI